MVKHFNQFPICHHALLFFSLYFYRSLSTSRSDLSYFLREHRDLPLSSVALVTSRAPSKHFPPTVCAMSLLFFPSFFPSSFNDYIVILRTLQHIAIPIPRLGELILRGHLGQCLFIRNSNRSLLLLCIASHPRFLFFFPLFLNLSSFSLPNRMAAASTSLKTASS